MDHISFILYKPRSSTALYNLEWLLPNCPWNTIYHAFATPPPKVCSNFVPPK